MSQPTRAEMITAAVALLRGGLLPSALPNRLMVDYSLSAERAREISQAAIKRWRVTKPLNSAGNGGKESEKPGE
jgi:hypothetical protein